MLTLRPYIANSCVDEAEVRALSVHPEQLPYIGTTEQILDEFEAGWSLHVLEVSRQIVGLFNLDTHYQQNYDFAQPGDLGFRAFMIDHKYQGRGYGKAVMRQLPAYAKTAFAARYRALCLTVNVNNLSAYRLYTGHGFVDAGELYHGGKAGAQHILRCSLVV